MSDTVLSLADSDAIQNVMHGRDTTIKERGELLMFDLCKSTQLSIELGSDRFQKLGKAYSQIVAEQMSKADFKLQMVIGDALLFTKSETLGFTDRHALIDLIHQCEASLKEIVQSEAPGVLSNTEASLRVCSVVGDVSRGVIKGTGGGWAITGSTISEIHKIESVAKKFRSGIYFELKNQGSDSPWLMDTKTPAWPGSLSVQFLEYRRDKDKKIA